MGMNYQLVPEHRLVVVVGIGHVTFDKETLFYKNLLEEPALDEGYSFLIDYTRKEDELTSSDDVRRLAMFSKQQKTAFSTEGKVAVIASRDLTFGLARMHQVHAELDEDAKYQLFRDEEDALKWLGIPISLLEEVRNCLKESSD